MTSLLDRMSKKASRAVVLTSSTWTMAPGSNVVGPS